MTIDDNRPLPARPKSPPAFNVPGVVLATIAALVLVEAVRRFALSPEADVRLVLDFAFIPGCYGENCSLLYERRSGADLWSPLSHAFLHGDWTHLGLNTVWLLAFGSPVARRLGASRFLLFSGFGALAGAGLFYALNPDLMVPVIGASGVVSALMGGASRFALAGMGRTRDVALQPRLTILQALADRTILFFILVFFATNLLTASDLGGFIDGGAEVAWEAHLGGFAFGFLCFALFDRALRENTHGLRRP